MGLKLCTECNTMKNIPLPRTTCEACRKRAQRSKNPVGVAKETSAETAEEWLARRVIETGSTGWQWVKTGNPAGEPRIKVPIKWELSDIDASLKMKWPT